MDNIVDHWLHVSERIDDNMESLSSSMALWDDVLKIGDDIDGWSNSTISQMSESISHLNNGQRMKASLERLRSEVANKGPKLQELHSKVSELKELTKSQEPLAELQFMEADLRQKLEHAKEMSEMAKGTLKGFSTQKAQLQRGIECQCGDCTREGNSRVRWCNKSLKKTRGSARTGGRQTTCTRKYPRETTTR